MSTRLCGLMCLTNIWLRKYYLKSLMAWEPLKKKFSCLWLASVPGYEVLYVLNSSGEICGWNLKLVILNLMSRINILSIFCEIALRWMPQALIGDYSTLVQVMALCLMSQHWSRFLCHHMASLSHSELTHCDLMVSYCIVDLGQHWVRKLYPIPCWLVIYKILGNTYPWFVSGICVAMIHTM